MARFRVEKTRDYTVMSNHHLKNRALSLKAKGLMSFMLSLPDEWDYTTRGLAAINKEGVDGIGSALKELEKEGYLERNRLRDDRGRIADIEYVIYEHPRDWQPQEKEANLQSKASKDMSQTPLNSTLPPRTAFPDVENPDVENPDVENPSQINTKEINTNKLNINQSIYQDISSNTTSRARAREEGGQTPPGGAACRIDTIDRKEAEKTIRKNIDYEHFCITHPKMLVDEILDLLVETVCTTRKTVRIGGDDMPAETVRGRFMTLEHKHIEYVLGCIDENTTKVRNIKAYLLTSLYNAPMTVGHYYAVALRHDFNDEYG